MFFEEALDDLYPRLPLKPVPRMLCFGDWRDACLDWLRRWTEPDTDADGDDRSSGTTIFGESSNDDEGVQSEDKKPHLYLWGQADTGKSAFVKRVLLRGLPDANIFEAEYPRRRYTWSKFSQKRASVVLVDDFAMNKCGGRETWEKALSGGLFHRNVNKNTYTNWPSAIRIRSIPIIFVSNNPLPTSSTWRNHLCVVYTGHGPTYNQTFCCAKHYYHKKIHEAEKEQEKQKKQQQQQESEKKVEVEEEKQEQQQVG